MGPEEHPALYDDVMMNHFCVRLRQVTAAAMTTS